MISTDAQACPQAPIAHDEQKSHIALTVGEQWALSLLRLEAVRVEGDDRRPVEVE